MTEQMELFKVGGTMFRFPVIPEDGGRGAELLRERRDAILAAARKVKRQETAWKAPRVAHIKPGDATFTPKPGEPGSVITLDDGREAEVWSAAPAPRSVWALLADGTCVEVSLRYGNRVTRTWKWSADVRRKIVGGATTDPFAGIDENTESDACRPAVS